MKLPQLRFRQKINKLELTDHHDLQQFFLVCFKIRDDPDLFECRHRNILRFIQQDNRTTVFLEHGNQKRTELGDKVLLALARRRGNAEVVQDSFQQFQFVQKRIQKEGRVYVVADRTENGAAQRRFASTDVAVSGHETFAPWHCV